MHAVRGGARVSSGEHSGQVRIVLFGAVQQRSPADVLEGGFGVKSTQDSGIVGLGQVLYGFDHFVGSIGAGRSVLKDPGRRHDGLPFGSNDGLEREAEKDKRRSGWCPPEGLTSGVTCPALGYWRTASGSEALATKAMTRENTLASLLGSSRRTSARRASLQALGR